MSAVLLFDADGVVIIGEHAGDAFAREHGIAREMTRPFFEGEFLDCLVGQADLKQVLPPYLNAWGWSSTVEEYLDYWFKVEHSVDEALLAEIDRLRESGTPCYLATNQEHYRSAYLEDAMGMGRHFDAVFSSAASGIASLRRSSSSRSRAHSAPLFLLNSFSSTTLRPTSKRPALPAGKRTSTPASKPSTPR